MKNSRILQIKKFIKVKRNYWCYPKQLTDIFKQKGKWYYRIFNQQQWEFKSLNNLIQWLIK